MALQIFGGGASAAALSNTFAAVDKVAPKTTVALIGTSLTAQNSPIDGYDATATTYQWDSLGYWSWAQIKLRHRVKMTAQKGVGGNTTTQMLARFDADILALNPLPGWLVIEPGPNDAGAGLMDAATSITNITAMVNKATKAGIRVALGTVTPSTYITTTAQKQARALTNYWIKNTAPQLFPGLVVVDWALPLTLAAGGPNTAYFKNETSQYVHPNNQGAAIMGQVLADSLAQFVPSFDVLANDPTDPYVISNNPFGTGGTASTLPTNWVATDQNGAALVGSVATIASTDGNPASWGQLTVTSGTGRIYSRAVTGSFSVGDLVEASCEFETDAGGWAGTDLSLSLACIDTVAGGASTGGTQALSTRSADTQNPTRLASGILRTPRIVVPASTNRLEMRFLIKNASVTRIRRMVIRRIAS